MGAVTDSFVFGCAKIVMHGTWGTWTTNDDVFNVFSYSKNGLISIAIKPVYQRAGGSVDISGI